MRAAKRRKYVHVENKQTNKPKKNYVIYFAAVKSISSSEKIIQIYTMTQTFLQSDENALNHEMYEFSLYLTTTSQTA